MKNLVLFAVLLALSTCTRRQETQPLPPLDPSGTYVPVTFSGLNSLTASYPINGLTFTVVVTRTGTNLADVQVRAPVNDIYSPGVDTTYRSVPMTSRLDQDGNVDVYYIFLNGQVSNSLASAVWITRQVSMINFTPPGYTRGSVGAELRRVN